jgi:hypothetical protein
MFVLSFQMDVLQETVKYIEDLERRLLERVRVSGLPARLQKLDAAADGVRHHLPSENSDGSPSLRSSGGGGGLEIQDLRHLLHTSLQPGLQHKLKKQQLEDEARLHHLMEERGLSTALLSHQ